MKKIDILEQLRDLEQTYKMIRSLNGKHRFDHAKIKEVLLNEIPKDLRIEYHAIIAKSIEDLNKDNLEEVIGDLAFHYYNCKDKSKALVYLVKAANKARQEYSNEEAIRFYLQTLEFEDDVQNKLEIFEALGDIYDLIGDYDRCVEFYNHILGSSQRKKRAEIMAKIGDILVKKGDYDRSLMINSQALELIKDEGCKEEALIFQSMFSLHYHRAEIDKAREYIEKSLNISENIHDKMGFATSLRHKGMVSGGKGDITNPMEYFQKSLKIYEEIGYQRGIARSLIDIGISYLPMGEYEKGLEYFEESLKINEKIGDQQQVGICFHNIACTYSHLENFNMALEYYEKSLKITEKIGFQDLNANNYSGIANTFIEIGNLKKALEFCDIAFELAKKIENKDYIAECCKTYGNINSIQNNWDAALKNFHESIRIFKELDQKLGLAGSYHALGSMWEKRGDIEKASIYLNKANEVSEKSSGDIFGVRLKLPKLKEKK